MPMTEPEARRALEAEILKKLGETTAYRLALYRWVRFSLMLR